MSTIRISNHLDPGQGRRSVGPDLGPTCDCLQMLSVDDKRRQCIKNLILHMCSKILNNKVRLVRAKIGNGVAFAHNHISPL